MAMTYPGSVIEYQGASGKEFLNGLFVGGKISLSQITGLTNLKPPTLQNWVSRGFLSHPEGKKYDKNQLARILIINSLRNAMKLEDIMRLLVFVNGDPEDQSDNIIDESELYVDICEVVLRSDFSINTTDCHVASVLDSYNERFKGAKERLKIALDIICKTYIATELLQEAQKNLENVTPSNIFGKTF